MRSAMDNDDPLQWELDQIGKLKDLASIYGWDPDGAEYKKRIKLIQARSVSAGRRRMWRREKVSKFRTRRRHVELQYRMLQTR